MPFIDLVDECFALSVRVGPGVSRASRYHGTVLRHAKVACGWEGVASRLPDAAVAEPGRDYTYAELDDFPDRRW